MNNHPLEVIEVPQRRCFELVALDIASAAAPQAGWPTHPGAVRTAVSGGIEALHFAPGRWLLPDPPGELLAAISGWPAASLVDVEGKWQRRSLRGRHAMRLLAAGADVEAMLSGRECAALALFDCPVIVARASAAMDLWVQSSYARFLEEQLTRALSGVEHCRDP